MTRRDFLAAAAALPACHPPARADEAGARVPADFILRIQELTADLGAGNVVKTVAYNGRTPGPVLRVREGTRISVDVINETREPEMVHWHGLHVPSEVDGAVEEGTPLVQARDTRRFTFAAQPAGTRWYHAHAMAGLNLNKGTYTGQFGMFIVEPRENPARYDQEVPIVLHGWNGFFSSGDAMDIDYRTFTVNGRMLGSGEPVRVKRSERVLFRVLNAGATMGHRLALPGHQFEIVALDGNPVAQKIRTPVLELAPGERVDAIVEMTTSGIWIFGDTDERRRAAGAGVVIEYAGAVGHPLWTDPPAFQWDYTAFGIRADPPPAESRIVLVFEPRSDGNLWAINGKSFPDTEPFFVDPGARNRLVFDNRTDMAHPVHLHRHTLEITRYAGKACSGVFKDVLPVPQRSIVEADLLPNTPGPSLFHCHHQFHMDFGFMALMQYRR